MATKFVDRDDRDFGDPADTAPAQLADYRPVQLVRRHNGWTAERQRTFLTVLAETGSISEACRAAGVSARSAYRLRQRPDATAFAEAWEQALRLATVRLTTLAYERAIKGTVREVWRDDQLVGSTRTPSDKLLVFVLQHLLPRLGGAGASDARGGGAGMATGNGGASRLDRLDADAAAARAAFPATLATLADHDVEMVPIASRDFFPAPPGDPEEDM